MDDAESVHSPWGPAVPSRLRPRLKVQLAVLGALALCVVLLLPESRLWLWGTVTREQFYAGMPTSYWAFKRNDKVILRLREDGTEALPVLVEMLDSDHPSVVIFAAGELERLGPEARTAVPALEQAREGKFRHDDGVLAAIHNALHAIRSGGRE